MMMDGMDMAGQNKPWYLSRTIWAGIAGIVLGIAQEAGVQINPEEAKALGDSLFNLGSIIAGIIVIWGRDKATKNIEWKR